MDAADRLLADMGLERGQRRPVEERRPDAEGLEFLGLAVREIAPALAAIGLDPAALAQKRLGAGVPSELQMLGRRPPP